MSSSKPRPYAPNTLRVRTRGVVPAQELATETLSGASTGNGIVSSFQCPGHGHYEEMTDYLTDRFKRRSAFGELIFNPMSRTVLSVTGTSSGPEVMGIKGTNNVYPNNLGWKYTVRGNVLSRYANVLSQLAVGDGTYLRVRRSDSIDTAAVIREATTKAQAVPSDASLLVTLAESRQALRLVPDLLSNWAKLFAKINSRNASLESRVFGKNSRSAGTRSDVVKRNLADLERALIDTWLAMRFGARPLVADTLGVAKALQRARVDSVVRSTSRGGSFDSASGTQSAVAPYGITRTTISGQLNDSYVVRAMQVWEAKVDVLDDLGINLANVPVALVDLTSFSFVLNWIVNVNDFASAVGSALQPGWANRGGCYVARRETSLYATAVGTTITDTTNYALSRALEGHVGVVEVTSSRIPGLPQPSLGLRGRPLAFLDDFRLLDAVALVRQQTRGRGVQRLAKLL